MSDRLQESAREVASQVADSWSRMLGQRPDLEKYVSDTLDSVFPRMLENMVYEKVRSAIGRRMDEIAVQWAIDVAMPLGSVSKKLQKEFEKAIEDVDPVTVAEDIKSHQIAAYRMWSQGESVDAIAEKLGVAKSSAERLLKRARNRVRTLRQQLGAYE